MIPDNELSSSAVISGFSFPVKQPGDELVDWELAGVYLNDPSQGLLIKLWRVDAVANADTGLRDIIVTAPGGVAWGESSRVLFSGADITEVALSFDQNMNPFVAYTQGSAAKIYWYDPTLPGMTHTTLPVGIVTMRCTLDDKREVATSGSDIILSYIRAGNLCVRYQNERYTVEHVLRSGVGAGAELVSLAMNNGSRLQWRLRGYALSDDPGALIKTEPFLSEVVESICIQSGVPRQSINVQELWDDFVPGVKIDTDEGLDKPMNWLREIYYFDKSEKDKKLHWVKRGGEVVVRIPYKHLVEGTPTPLRQVLVDEKKLPRIVNLNHLDPDAGHAKNKQTAERRSNLVQSNVTKTIESQVVLTVDQAATAAMTRLKVYHNELIEYSFSTTLRYTELTVTDIVEVEDESGAWHRMRLEERNEDSKIIEWTGVQDAGSITYKKNRTGNTLPLPISSAPGIIGESMLEIIDCSPLFDQDDELGLYIAAAGVPGTTWRGYQLMVSVDGGLSYTEAISTSVPSTIGETLTDLPAETPVGTHFPSAETFEVTTNFPLVSVTSAQVLAGANRFCIGGEIGQFETATLLGMVDTLYHYEISGLTRARYGTYPLLWPSGTRFVILDETVIFVQAQRAMIGVDIEHKPVSFGRTLDDTIATDYLFDDPASQIEWEPDDLAAVRDIVSNDITVTFVPRPRLGQFGTPFNSKYWRGSRVKFSDAHTIDTLGDSVVYPAAPPGVTVQVCGLNEITGEGPYSPAVTPT